MKNAYSWFEETFSGFWEEAGAWALNVLPTIIKCAAILILGYWLAGALSRLLRRALRRSKASEELATFAGSGLRIALRVLVVIWAVSMLNINIVSVLTALSAVGITLGLALKDTITSFTGGFVIMSSKPFKAGDLVEIDGHLGRVSKIEMMNTTLLTNDNKTVVIPNCLVTATTVINYTENPHRRIDLRFTVAPETDLELAKSVIEEVAKTCPYRLADKAVALGVSGVTGEGTQIEVRTWINANDYTGAGFDIRERTVKAFAENGIKSA